MPVGINQPSNQIKLTNVAYVRMKKGKKRYEIACYKNKVLEWRSGVEKVLDNVIQLDRVYVNVSKGEAASKADLDKAFGKGKTTKAIIEEILNEGQMQVGEKERNAELERTHNEVINIVASKLVDPKTKRVYTTGMIEKALDSLSSQTAHQQQAKAEGAAAAETEEQNAEPKLPKWRGVVAGKDAKKQANFAMKALVAHQPIPVAKARMLVKVACPASILKYSVKHAPKAQSSEDPAENESKGPKNVKDTILGLMEQVESQEVLGDEWEVVGFVEPGAVKTLTDFIGGQTKGRGRLEVLDMAVIDDED